MIAALFVQTNGAYYGIDDIDPWDEARDARKYAGPWPIVAHPPCARWGRYWFGGPSARKRCKLGDDDGCFSSALGSLRKWGGVLEHPAHSYAWKKFMLGEPPAQGWGRDIFGGWSTSVDQGHYGHRARKPTWLYFVGEKEPASLIGGPSKALARIDDGFHSAEERAAARADGWQSGPRLSAHERAATPPEFRAALLNIARSVGVVRGVP